MREYNKIHSVYKRTPKGVFIPGQYARPEVEYLADGQWTFTEKVDGTNIRLGWSPEDGFRIGGRTARAQIPVFLLEALEELGLRDTLAEHFDGPVVLYGEGYGPRIQKDGHLYRDTPGFVLFDVRVGDLWLRRADVEDVAATLGLDVVPLVFHGTLREAIERVSRPEGIRSAWGDFRAEGVVGTPLVQLFGRDGERVIVKVKSRDFDRLRRSGAA